MENNGKKSKKYRGTRSSKSNLYPKRHPKFRFGQNRGSEKLTPEASNELIRLNEKHSKNRDRGVKRPIKVSGSLREFEKLLFNISKGKKS